MGGNRPSLVCNDLRPERASFLCLDESAIVTGFANKSSLKRMTWTVSPGAGTPELGHSAIEASDYKHLTSGGDNDMPTGYDFFWLE